MFNQSRLDISNCLGRQLGHGVHRPGDRIDPIEGHWKIQDAANIVSRLFPGLVQRRSVITPAWVDGKDRRVVVCAHDPVARSIKGSDLVGQLRSQPLESRLIDESFEAVNTF